MLNPCSTERSTALLAATSSVFGFVFDSARTEFDCGGHQSVRITEKHYAPWVRARQEQLEADVRRTWEAPEPQRRVHGGYAKKRTRVIPFKSRRKNGAGGGNRTHGLGIMRPWLFH